MAEGQLTFKDTKIIEILNSVYQCLKEGAFVDAIELIEKALEVDLDYPGLSSILKCAGFWKERREKEIAAKDDFGKGELLFAQWKLFLAFSSRLPDAPERCLYAIKQHVFTRALDHYSRLVDPTGGEGGAEAYATGAGRTAGSDPDVLFAIGRCYKGLGNYESAIRILEGVNGGRPNDPGVLAELADCYSLVNETRAAKVFFREAFFLDPQGIDLASLESPLVHRLAARLREMGFAEPELNEWLPVYGTIHGVFNVKREMKPLELGKLKQSIYLLEKEAAGGLEPGSPLVPRLINRYFWLIDHYMSSGDERERIEEVLGKIKELNPQVYTEYTN